MQPQRSSHASEPFPAQAQFAVVPLVSSLLSATSCLQLFYPSDSLPKRHSLLWSPEAAAAAFLESIILTLYFSSAQQYFHCKVTFHTNYRYIQIFRDSLLSDKIKQEL